MEWIRQEFDVVRGALIAVFLTLLLASACGSGATEGPDNDAADHASNGDTGGVNGDNGSDDNGGNDGSGDDANGGNGGDDEFGWGLPEGDTGVSTNEALIYQRLYEGNCEGARELLSNAWSSLLTQRAVLLYQAAIDFCRGNRSEGARWFRQADERFGWTGLQSSPLDCSVYQSIRSVLEQKHPDSFQCPSGERPGWPEGGRDDPRTPENEATSTTVESTNTDESSRSTAPTTTVGSSSTTSVVPPSEATTTEG
jgi:hypothetical protein